MTERTIQFSPTIQNQPLFLKVVNVSSLISYGGWLLVVGFIWPYLSDLLSVLGLGASWIIPASIFLSGLVVDLLLRGQKSYKFDSQFWTGKRHGRAALHHPVATLKDLQTPRVRPLKVAKNKTLPAIENEFHVIAPVDFRITGIPIGGLLLEHDGSLRLAFFWHVQTIPSSIRPQKALELATQLRESLRQVPRGESITFRAKTWRSYRERIAQLKDPAVNTNPISKIINHWEVARVLTQTALGRRLTKTVTATATYTTLTGREEAAQDGVEQLVDVFASLWGDAMRMFGVKSTANFNNVPAFLRTGFDNSWSSYNRLLSRQMGLDSTPLTCDQVWAQEYSRYNDGDVPECPFRIVVTSREVKIERKSDLHLKSQLFKMGPPQMDHKHHVLLPGRGEKGLYVAGAVWEEKPLLKYDATSEAHALAQLFWGSAVLNDSDGPTKATAESEVWDTEIVVQYTGVSQDQVRKRAAKLEKESNFARKKAAEKGEISGASNFKLSKTVDDIWALAEGGQVCSVAWTALCYRENPLDADRAVSDLCGLPVCKGFVVPEKQYFPALWKQTLPIYHGALASGPGIGWERRMQDFTEAAASFVPVIADYTRNTTGLEFQSEYGSSPFYVELCPPDASDTTIALAESGAGKSVILSGRACLRYTRGIRSFIVDATQGDVSTFKPVCDALGGGYFNSAERCFNFLQGGDLRRHEHDPEKYEFAVSLLQNQWTQTIPDLAVGGRHDPGLRADYGDICAMLVSAWMRDPEIRRRYDIAFDGGFGSGAWQVMPTLRTFLEWSNSDHFPSDSRTEDNERILADFKSRLGAFLSRPNGERIAKPSDFDTDKPIVVCALGDVNNMSETDALPLISAVLGLTTSAALTYDAVGVEIDEASVLCRYPCVRVAAGGYASGGRKQAIYLGMYGQDLPSIQGEGSSKYIGNCKTLMIGRVTEDASHYLAHPDKGLGLPLNLLQLVDQGSSPPLRREGYSRWVVRYEGKFLVGRYSPSFFQMAITFNGKEIDKLRNPILDKYPNDRLAGYVEFARFLKARSLDSTAKIEQFTRGL